MKHLLMTLLVVTCAAMTLVTYAAPQQMSGARPPTIEQLIDMRHPSSPAWSPDGRRVAFVSERAGIANIFVANADPSASSGQVAAARALTHYSDGQGGPFFWSADSQWIYFSRQGDLW